MIMLSATIIQESISYESIPVPQSLLMAWLTWSIIGVISVFVAWKPKIIPGKLQLFVEFIIGYVFKLADENIGSEKARRYYPLLLGLFFFILIGNLLGLVPGCVSPTGNLNTTFGLALLVFLIFNFEGIRVQGLSYFKHLLGPQLPWYLFPVRVLFVMTEVISLFVKPLSLGMRLFCNVFSKELFLGVLAILIIQFLQSPDSAQKWYSLGPAALRPVILLLGLMLGIIQAVVFVLLTISYIGGAISTHEQ